MSGEHGPPVTILLSTHDGAAFLADQLSSFLIQDHAGWVLRWRDDGSSDDTRTIMEGFASAAAQGRVVPLADDGAHLGIGASFLALLRAHVGNADAACETGIVAFADQDDVWLPEKLRRGVSAFADVPAGRPALYCARQMLVDARLRTLGPSPSLLRPPGFPNALTQNVATGCTVMLNAPAARLLASIEAPEGSLHDWWAYLVIAAAGGTLLVDGLPVVLYRQHGANAVGAPLSPFRRGGRALRRGPSNFMTLLRAHVAGLRAASAHLTPESNRALAEIERALEGNLLARLRTLRALRLGRQTLSETLLFRFWFAVG